MGQNCSQGLELTYNREKSHHKHGGLPASQEMGHSCHEIWPTERSPSPQAKQRCSSFTYFIHKTILLSRVFCGSSLATLSFRWATCGDGGVNGGQDRRDAELTALRHTAEWSPQTLYLPGSGLCPPQCSHVLWATVFPSAPLWPSESTSLGASHSAPLWPSHHWPVQNPHLPLETQSRRAGTWPHRSLGGTCHSLGHTTVMLKDH